MNSDIQQLVTLIDNMPRTNMYASRTQNWREGQIQAKTHRALKMLQKGSHVFHIEMFPGKIRGVVESQRKKGLLYSPRIQADGRYTCGNHTFNKCLGIYTRPSSLCKHGILLLMAAVKSQLLTAVQAFDWIHNSLSRSSRYNADESREIFEIYKNRDSKVEFRIVEIIPEDIMAF